MNDHAYILQAIIKGDLTALDDIAQIVDSFPAGREHGTDGQHWITHGIGCGSLAVIEWMLAHGAPVVFPDKGDGRQDGDDGYTVLHSALERRRPDRLDVLRRLIDAGADVDAQGINDWTPAHMAAFRNDVDALKILGDAGADFSIRTRIDDRQTPLEEALSSGKTDAVRYLQSRA